MKCIQILLLALCLVCFNPYKVQAHGPWKYHPYQIPVYPPYPRYPEFVQQNTKPANICTECLNTWANFAKIFNFPDFSQFGNPNFNNGNIRATRPPSYKPTTTVQPILANTRPAVTDTLQTIRPPVPRRSTVKPAVVQPGNKIGLYLYQKFKKERNPKLWILNMSDTNFQMLVPHLE
ncbi:hypothetical protein ACKWTF_004525 [Chironomus riparius]